MQAQFIVNQLTFQLTAETAKDLFTQVAQIQEVFEAETKCGCCQSESIRYHYREHDQYKFYELLCRDCGAQFAFGQKKQGGFLFPKRTDDGKPLPNGGWSKYDPSKDTEGSRQPRDQQQASRPGAARPPANGKPTPIAKYMNWDEAEQDRKNFGRGPLEVDGTLYVMNMKIKEYEPYQAPR